MAENLITMQHVSKGPAAFTHAHVAVESDEDGIIAIPAEFTTQAKAHGFTAIASKPAPKPLAKDAGGAKGGDKKKPGDAEDAGGAKGGDGK
ncbi:MAG TPA: hypothetical protein VHW09_26875 [Bryobacteraceae bacterium]|jgi:hypothetical protein|nr:hypothetical protein [Bryobacteraceae bacterium]